MLWLVPKALTCKHATPLVQISAVDVINQTYLRKEAKNASHSTLHPREVFANFPSLRKDVAFSRKRMA